MWNINRIAYQYTWLEYGVTSLEHVIVGHNKDVDKNKLKIGFKTFKENIYKLKRIKNKSQNNHSSLVICHSTLYAPGGNLLQNESNKIITQYPDIV